MKFKFMCMSAVILSIIAISFSSYAVIQINRSQDSLQISNKQLVSELLSRAKASVVSSSDITLKSDVITLLDHLNEKGLFLESGSDGLRVKFVHAQGSIEQVLSCALILGEISHLVGVIHTPQPATPLCTEVTNIDEQLLDASIRYNLDKLLTIRSRAVILRDYLDKGGTLYIAYPQGGLEKRSPAQQKIYLNELNRYAGKLVDAVLSCTSMDPDKVGATYFLKDEFGDIYAFSIKSRQANDPSENSEWGVWFGLINDPTIKSRVDEILNYLEDCDGPPLREELKLL